MSTSETLSSAGGARHGSAASDSAQVTSCVSLFFKGLILELKPYSGLMSTGSDKGHSEEMNDCFECQRRVSSALAGLSYFWGS